MERYDYNAAVREDVLEAIRNNYTPEEICEALQDRDEFAEKLHDDLWIDDSVTGNASGSYYCNAWKAEEAIAHNLELLGEALQVFCCGPEYLMEHGAEAADVTIRCYLLDPAISDALDELEKEYPPEEEYDFDIFCSKFAGCQNCPFYNFQTVDECREAFEKRKAEKDGEQ